MSAKLIFVKYKMRYQNKNGGDIMGVTIGMPSLKLNDVGLSNKHCGNFKSVAEEALKERKGRDADIDSTKSSENISKGFQTAAELIGYSEKHISQLNDHLRSEGKRGIRKDAVKMCVTIIKPPAEWIKSLSKEEQINFFEDALVKFEEIVGKDNIKAVAIHFDEQAPHMHIFWEPMTKDERLCAKDAHNWVFFSKLNREMPKYLRSKGWEIDDCHAYDSAEEQELKQKLGKEKYLQYLQEKRAKNGRSSFKYKAEMEAENEKLVKATTVSPEKKVIGLLGREKVVAKTEQEIRDEMTILAAQAVLIDKDQARRDKEYYQKLKDNEEELIEQKSEEKARSIVTKRELEAIKKARRAEDMIIRIDERLEAKYKTSVNELLNEKKEPTKNISTYERRENYDRVNR